MMTYRQLIKSAAPTSGYIVLQSSGAIVDLAVIGTFGETAVASYGLVVPFLMLLQTLSTGAVGGALASAVARAHEREHFGLVARLITHSWYLAAGLGILYYGLVYLFGTYLFVFVTENDAVHEQAVTFVFYGFLVSPLVWLANLQASVLRGLRRFLLPACGLTLGLIFHISISVSIGAGWLPTGPIGVSAVLFAQGFGSALSATWMIWCLRRKLPEVWPSLRAFEFHFETLSSLRRIGGLSALASVQTVGTLLILNVWFGAIGTTALAAYTIAVRFELFLIALVAGLGLAATSFTSGFAAKDDYRAGRQATVKATVVACGIGIGAGVSLRLFGNAWAELFTNDPHVINAVVEYFSWVYLSYWLLLGSIVLYHGAQGAGNPMWAVLGGTMRFLLCGVGGWFIVEYLGLESDIVLYYLIILSSVLFFLSSGYGLTRRDWYYTGQAIESG